MGLNINTEQKHTNNSDTATNINQTFNIAAKPNKIELIRKLKLKLLGCLLSLVIALCTYAWSTSASDTSTSAYSGVGEGYLLFFVVIGIIVVALTSIATYIISLKDIKNKKTAESVALVIIALIILITVANVANLL